MTEDNPKFKVVFVGDSTVGKTSIIHKYMNLEQVTTSTLGATSTRVDYVYENFGMIMNVWDTAGQESFRNLVPVYAKGANAIVIVFDQANESSFNHLNDWYKYLKENVEMFRCIVVANKIDLEPVIDINDAYEWASAHGAEIVKVSAKDGTNISNLFEVIGKQLYEYYNECLKKKENKDNYKNTKVDNSNENEKKDDNNSSVEIDKKQEKVDKKGCC